MDSIFIPNAKMIFEHKIIFMYNTKCYSLIFYKLNSSENL